jgi:hypothetical protein
MKGGHMAAVGGDRKRAVDAGDGKPAAERKRFRGGQLD